MALDVTTRMFDLRLWLLMLFIDQVQQVEHGRLLVMMMKTPLESPWSGKQRFVFLSDQHHRDVTRWRREGRLGKSGREKLKIPF